MAYGVVVGVEIGTVPAADVQTIVIDAGLEFTS
jgi:hypothetical protein